MFSLKYAIRIILFSKTLVFASSPTRGPHPEPKNVVTHCKCLSHICPFLVLICLINVVILVLHVPPHCQSAFLQRQRQRVRPRRRSLPPGWQGQATHHCRSRT